MKHKMDDSLCSHESEPLMSFTMMIYPASMLALLGRQQTVEHVPAFSPTGIYIGVDGREYRGRWMEAWLFWRRRAVSVGLCQLKSSKKRQVKQRASRKSRVSRQMPTCGLLENRLDVFGCQQKLVNTCSLRTRRCMVADATNGQGGPRKAKDGISELCCSTRREPRKSQPIGSSQLKKVSTCFNF